MSGTHTNLDLNTKCIDTDYKNINCVNEKQQRNRYAVSKVLKNLWSYFQKYVKIILVTLISIILIVTLASQCAYGERIERQKYSPTPGRKVIATSFTDTEVVGAEDRDILRDIKTSFLPPSEAIPVISLTDRRRRHIDKLEKLRKVSPAQVPHLFIDDEDTPWKIVESVNNDEQVEDEEVLERLLEPDSTNGDTDTPPHSFWRNQLGPHEIRKAQAKMMKSYMDLNSNPCDDFYQYACGNWHKVNPIPADKAGYDTFEMLRESLDSVLRDLLLEPIEQVVFDDRETVYVPETDYSLVQDKINLLGEDIFEEDKPSGLNITMLDGSVQLPDNDTILKPEDDALNKAKHLFRSCMNYDVLKKRRHAPLLELLDTLGGWPLLDPSWDPIEFDWLDLTAKLRLFNNDILISEWVGPDIKNSEEYVIQLDQTSLGLPTRDYFLEDTNRRYLEAYRSYLIKIVTLLGVSLSDATKDANELIAFETALANITAAPEDRRNVTELYRRMTVGNLHTMVPQIDWFRYLSTLLRRPVEHSESVVCFSLSYFQDLVILLGQTPPRTISNYLLWRFVRHRVNNLDDRFQDAKQRFYFVLFGREKSPPRWQNCVAQVNSNMGMAVGSMFVKKYFDEMSKNDTLKTTTEIQQAFRELLSETKWLDDETRRLAAEKVDAMRLKIGYPDFILDRKQLALRYYDARIHPSSYFENTLSILQHLTRTEQAKLGTPVNKSLWNTAPAVVNAYYSRNKNQIMFPAGILQPPFYQRYFPRSLNYGGIGVVIGHEITHGFDDKGRLFDRDGNLQRWWKDEAIEGFHKHAQCLIDQYGHYTVTEVGLQIDGINTQGENIADNGGIKQAFRAYKKWLQTHGDEHETLPGLNATNKQLFFLNFAQVWCGAMRPEATRNKLKTAVHSPGRYRVIGTLSNSEDFAREFSCPEGSPMNPPNKCSVW